jgi:hypothetical protein
MVQHMGVGIGQHIGGKGQRQHQCEFEHPAQRKLGHRHQPRGAGPDDEGEHRHQRDQRQRRGGVARQNAGGELGKRLGPARQRRQGDAEEWQKAGQRDEHRDRAKTTLRGQAWFSPRRHACLRPKPSVLINLLQRGMQAAPCDPVAAFGHGLRIILD